MKSMNKVILKGNVGKDPELRQFQNGGEVVNFSLATTESYKKDGEWVDVTEWHNISVLNKHLIKRTEWLKKGSSVLVEGKIKSRKYTTKEGVEKVAFDIVVGPFGGDIVLCDRQESGGNNLSEKSGVTQAGEEFLPRGDDIPF